MTKRFLLIIKNIIVFPFILVVVMIGMLTWPIGWAINYIITGKEYVGGYYDEPWFMRFAEYLTKLEYK